MEENIKNTSWINRLWHQPPVFFPIAALFHVFLFVRALFDLAGTYNITWPTLLWYAAAMVLAAYCLLLKRWAALGYMFLTIAGVLLSQVLHVNQFYKELGLTAFPFDAIYSAILLFFYRRFR